MSYQVQRWTTLGFAAVVGCLSGLALADISGAERALYDWQSLAAGVLAVAAAGLTIIQMQRTDLASELRHEQIVKLSLREDVRRISRAASRNWKRLIEWGDEVAELSAKYFAARQAGRSFRDDEIAGMVVDISMFADEILNIHKQVARSGASELFDGPTARAFDRLEGRLAWIRQRHEELFIGEGAFRFFDEVGMSGVDTFLRELSLIRADAQIFAMFMGRLQKEITGKLD